MEKQVLMPSTSLLSRGVVSFFFLFFSSFFAQGQKTLFTEGFDSDTIFTTNSWTKIKTNSKDTIKLGNPRWDTFKEHFDASSVQSLLIPEPSPVNPQNESVLSPSISSLGEKALILTFYVKNLPLDLGTSSLNVWGSINDGLTYDTLWKSSAAKSVGVSWEYAHYWYKVRIELPALYDNQANVRIAFNYTFDASYGNSVYLDGVNLSSRPSHDIGIIKFVQPLSKGIYSNQETIKVMLKNTGSATLGTGTQLKMSYQIDTLAKVEEILTLNNDLLSMDQEMEYSFTQKADLANTHLIACPIKASVVLLGKDIDSNISNNNQIDMFAYNTLVSLPYTAIFEKYTLTDEAIWSVVDSNATEDEGATWSVSYRSYPSGNWPSAWTYNPNTYTQNTYADDYLFSPAFNCQAGQTYELKFDALTTHPLDSNSLSVYLTTSPDVVSLSATPLLDHFQVKAENTIAKTIRFTASQTSAYYLVFHANNAPRVAVRAGKLQISSVEINPLANSDIALKSINNPLKGNLSKTTALSVNIQNAGVQAISSSTFTIAYKVNGSGFVSEVLRDVSIPVNGIYTHTFTQTSNFANPGKYEVQIYLSNLLAPLHENANDTLNLSMQNTLTTLPYRPSNGEVYKDHSEESLTWETQDANKDGVNWVISDYFSVSAFSKQMPWRSGIPLEIGSEPANKDFLYSRPLALKAGSQYELSYLRVGVDNYSYMPQKDYMNVYLAVQNSTDFKPVQLLLNDTITEVGKWSTTLKDKPLFSKTIRFSPSKDSIYSLCFESISKLSDNCGGVDVLEISLHELSPVNLALVSVTPPSAACELSSTENLQVTVKNEGVGTADNFTIHYQIDSLPEISQSYTSESISAGQSIQKTIPNVDLSRIAKMNIKIWLTAAADTIHTNDTLCVNTEKYEALFPPYAYTFNNDTANARWASFTGNASESKWSLNTHTSTAKFTYSANADDFLASPCLDLEAGVTYKISFEAQRADAQYIEQLQLLFGRKQKEITNYTALQTFAIEDETFVPLSVYFTPSVSGIHYFAFHALTDNGGGMEIRNVKLNQIKPIDLAIEEIVSPVSGELSKAETVSVRIRNKTSESVNHIPVYCQIEGTLLSGTLDTKLDSNEALLYTFATPVDLSARKNYTLKAYVDYPYDYQHANDTICKNIVSKLAKDVRLDSILNTLDVIYPNMPVPLSIQLSNLGFDTLQWVTVAYLIEGKAAVIDTIHVSLATGASTLYTFAQNLVFTQAQSYTVKVYTLLDQDGNTQNDTLSCNFNVVERPVYDAGVTNLVSPKEGKPISDESVIVKVKNFGNTNLTNIPIVYTLNDEKPVQETISAIAIGEEIEYSFAKKANLDQAKKYIIKAYTLLDNDANKSNDTTLVTIQKVSIEAISKESFRIFPNPCSHIVTLSLEKNIETIELFNSTGQRVFYKTLQALNTYSISVANFPKGLYFVRVTTGKTPLIKKLIIE